MDIEMPVTSSESIPTGQAAVPSMRHIRARFRSLLWPSCQILCLAALAIASYFVVSRFLLQSFKVVGLSMAPTLQDSQHYLLNHWIYYLRSPHRAEIVVIRDPADSGFSVKR